MRITPASAPATREGGNRCSFPDISGPDHLGGWRYRGKDKPPGDVATWLIDWFQRTYPHEAREIERRFDQPPAA
jgi:hypothetical protein